MMTNRFMANNSEEPATIREAKVARFVEPQAHQETQGATSLTNFSVL